MVIGRKTVEMDEFEDVEIVKNEDLNEEAEYTGNKQDLEHMLLEAQRYLNIFHQIHIFNDKKKEEFNRSLVSMSSKVRSVLLNLPGGRVLVEYIEDYELKKGLRETKTLFNNDDPREKYNGSSSNEMDNKDLARTITATLEAYSRNMMQINEKMMQNNANAGGNSSSEASDMQYIAEVMRENNRQQIEMMKTFGSTLSQALVNSQKEMLETISKNTMQKAPAEGEVKKNQLNNEPKKAEKQSKPEDNKQHNEVKNPQQNKQQPQQKQNNNANKQANQGGNKAANNAEKGQQQPNKNTMPAKNNQQPQKSENVNVGNKQSEELKNHNQQQKNSPVTPKVEPVVVKNEVVRNVESFEQPKQNEVTHTDSIEEAFGSLDNNFEDIIKQETAPAVKETPTYSKPAGSPAEMLKDKYPNLDLSKLILPDPEPEQQAQPIQLKNEVEAPLAPKAMEIAEEPINTNRPTYNSPAFGDAMQKIKDAITQDEEVSLDDIDIAPVSLGDDDDDNLTASFAQSFATPSFKIDNSAERETASPQEDEEWEYVDEDGNPVNPDEWEYVDEDGNPVDLDEWEYVDEDGNPVNPDEWEYVDEDGNPAGR